MHLVINILHTNILHTTPHPTQALGMTWMEWMEQRTDEDVAREEAESDNLNDFKLYSGTCAV